MPIPRLDEETAEPQTLDEIREWWSGVKDALNEQRVAVLHAIQTGAPPAQRFVAMTPDEVNGYYEAQKVELDRLTMLNYVASAEATVKVYYFRRVGGIGGKWRDPVSKVLRDWYKKLSGRKQRQPDFDRDGILDIFKNARAVSNHVIGQFRECLQLRHWVAHGRFWEKPAVADRLDAEDVYARATTLIQALPV